MFRYFCAFLMNVFLLAGCQGRTISEMVNLPSMSKMGSDLYNQDRSALLSRVYFKNPRVQPKSYSLWRDSHSGIFKDARTLDIGDILTVDIRIDDKAMFDNKTKYNRDNSLGKKLGGGFSFFGSKSPNMSSNINYGGNSASTGNGSISRSEKLDLLIAAIVTEILDNGNLIISGSQEVRVNDEMRILSVTGMVRPQDVDSRNSISYDKIAEARISYGGKGHATEIQKAPIGQQVIDAFSPL
ncbi:MAG: flagellar basal body L-ring protein FlgH [Candidatus Liberibacter ctenarytainae]|uniref:Flagellar L-ring protein n=1 Tax=Candidatus Liberibacter ctenarytainae TaxID=2020335 RepID=A0A937ABS6_9HYPH|nr:flagellar basal body L-ring protein FlgH [Candidatus Liberibacter ctenarytainae]